MFFIQVCKLRLDTTTLQKPNRRLKKCCSANLPAVSNLSVYIREGLKTPLFGTKSQTCGPTHPIYMGINQIIDLGLLT